MAVLAEALSVIVRLDSIKSKYKGGWDGFINDIPNRTLCFDNEIARIGFMTPHDVKTYKDLLECKRLRFLYDDKAIDMAVVDQWTGLTTDCDWLEFGRFKYEKEGMISMCWYFDEPRDKGAGTYINDLSMRLATPHGWKYEGSLSQTSKFIRTQQLKENLKFLRREGGLDVYLDLKTRKEVFIGRTSK